MEGGLSGQRQNADTLHLRDVATATMLWLSMGYNFGCMIASDIYFTADKSLDRTVCQSTCIKP